MTRPEADQAREPHGHVGQQVAAERGPELLTPTERLIAGAIALVLLVTALLIVLVPPDRRVALSNCPNAAAGCVVSVDNDMTALAAAFAAFGALAALIAILGIRFRAIETKWFKADSRKGDETVGLLAAPPQDLNPPAEPAIARASPGGSAETVPVKIEIEKGFAAQAGDVPVAITRLASPMSEIDPAFLRAYQLACRASQRSYFLTHVLGPPTQPKQKYSVAIKVTPHPDVTAKISSASFYLGKSWGNNVFPGQQGSDGRYGIVTEAYGPFLALCEVQFADGSRIVLDRYCDFGADNFPTV